MKCRRRYAFTSEPSIALRLQDQAPKGRSGEGRHDHGHHHFIELGLVADVEGLGDPPCRRTRPAVT